MKSTIPINKSEILKRYKPIKADTHKGIQGHALLVGGSYGKIGAMTLSSKACLKTGCGYSSFITISRNSRCRSTFVCYRFKHNNIFSYSRIRRRKCSAGRIKRYKLDSGLNMINNTNIRISKEKRCL